MNRVAPDEEAVLASEMAIFNETNKVSPPADLPGQSGSSAESGDNVYEPPSNLDVQIVDIPATPDAFSSSEAPIGKELAELKQPEEYVDVTWPMLIKEFSVLGWIGFGGPAAHIGLFQKVKTAYFVTDNSADFLTPTSSATLTPVQRLVEKGRWMSSEIFMELFALGQCLPGPASTQVSFALGVVKKGVLGEIQQGCQA